MAKGRRATIERGLEENKEPIAVVHIDLARHSKKEDKAGPDWQIPISKEGMKAAAEKGREMGGAEELADQIDAEGIVEIFGSPRERTVQSSLMRAFGERFKDVDFSNINPNELLEWLEQGGLVKIQSELLNFKEGDAAFSDEMWQSYDDGRWIDWLAKESDSRAFETKQDPDNVMTLSISAGNIAAFIYSLGKFRGQKMLEGGKANQQHLDFVTTHAGVLESFLYKVLRLKAGSEEVAEFVKKYNSGFNTNQGFQADFEIFGPADDDWQLKVDFGGKTYAVGPSELLGIMQQGNDLRDKLEKAREEK